MIKILKRIVCITLSFILVTSFFISSFAARAEDVDIETQSTTPGINLLRYTKDMPDNVPDYISFPSNVTRTVDDEGFTVIEIPATGGYINFNFYFNDYPISEIAGKEVTISALVCSPGLKNLPSGFQLTFAAFTSNNSRHCYLSRRFNDTRFYNTSDFKDDEWTLLVCKIKLPLLSELTDFVDTDDYLKYSIQIGTHAVNTQYPLEIKKLKCEFGFVDNPVWTPSPLDLQGSEETIITIMVSTVKDSVSDMLPVALPVCVIIVLAPFAVRLFKRFALNI